MAQFDDLLVMQELFLSRDEKRPKNPPSRSAFPMDEVLKQLKNWGHIVERPQTERGNNRATVGGVSYTWGYNDSSSGTGAYSWPRGTDVGTRLVLIHKMGGTYELYGLIMTEKYCKALRSERGKLLSPGEWKRNNRVNGTDIHNKKGISSAEIHKRVAELMVEMMGGGEL